MSSSPRRHRRRSSMEEPLHLSEVIHLKDRLNRLHEEISPECERHINTMSDQVKQFEKDYRKVKKAMIGGGVAAGAAAVVSGALAVFTLGSSLVIGGLSAVSILAAIIVAIVGFQYKYKENDFKKTLETELNKFQKNISPVIDMIEKIFELTEQILRDPTLSENQANAIREHFAYFSERMQQSQGDNRAVGDQRNKTLLFSGNLSETVAEISSVLNVLEEILEGEVKEASGRPAEDPGHTQMNKEEFKKKTETFIDDMKKGINQLKNIMNEVKQIKERL